MRAYADLSGPFPTSRGAEPARKAYLPVRVAYQVVEQLPPQFEETATGKVVAPARFQRRRGPRRTDCPPRRAARTRAIAGTTNQPTAQRLPNHAIAPFREGCLGTRPGYPHRPPQARPSLIL
jgi:hypothetical protein